MSSPQVHLRRSTRKSIVPSSTAKVQNSQKSSQKCTEVYTPTKSRTTKAWMAPSPKASSTVSIQQFNTPEVVSSPTSNPCKSRSNDILTTPKTPYVDPVMARIRRDLNSPSAGLVVRAKKALKSPNFRKQIYGQFDVPHERQDLITAEERKPMIPKTVADIFKDCKMYVEVRSGDDNRSAGIKSRLLRDGINVNEKLYKDTTHVIFKDGLLSTYKNAIKLGIPVASILWLDACKSQKRLVDVSKYKISNLDRYEHPELYPRLRRQKSMQPEFRNITTTPSSTRAMTQEEQHKIRSDNIFDETTEQNEQMELTLQNEKSSCQTTPQPMDVEECDNKAFDEWNREHRRITTYTPNVMEQTGVAAKLIKDRRRTLFTTQLRLTQTTEELLSPESSSGFNAFKSSTIVFNSANRISKNSRRSVFDISMNILDLNCKAINEQKRDQMLMMSPKEVFSTPTAAAEALATQEMKPQGQGVRKRKLFTDDGVFDEFKENHDKTITNSEKKPKLDRSHHVASYKNKTPQQKITTRPKVDRRRQTLAYFKTEKPKQVRAVEVTPAKLVVAAKVIVCTNMSQSDKKIIHLAISKLGGKVESEVTARTTHVVTPNEERTMNVLRGVIRACTIVNVNWIHESLEADKWLETGVYQHNICDSNKVYERSVLGTKNYKNMTFANVSFFFDKEAIDTAKKVEYLREVITLCNGFVTERKADAKIIVSDQPLMSSDFKQTVVNSSYIFDSAMKGACLEASRYIPKLMKS